MGEHLSNNQGQDLFQCSVEKIWIFFRAEELLKTLGTCNKMI